MKDASVYVNGELELSCNKTIVFENGRYTAKYHCGDGTLLFRGTTKGTKMECYFNDEAVAFLREVFRGVEHESNT